MAKLPGDSVRGSTTGRPIMVLLEVLGKRWTLRILWELSSGGSANFRDLRARCNDVSPTVLNRRLKELRELALVEHNEGGYDLTPQGEQLSKMLLPLDSWANKWAKTL